MSGGKGGGWFGKAAMKVHQKVSRDVCRPSMQKGKVTGGGVNRACFCLFACLLSLLPNHQQVLKISVCFSKWGTNNPCLKQFLRTTTTKNSSFTWRGARWLLCLAAHSGAVYVITQSLGLGKKKIMFRGLICRIQLVQEPVMRLEKKCQVLQLTGKTPKVCLICRSLCIIKVYFQKLCQPLLVQEAFLALQALQMVVLCNLKSRNERLLYSHEL